MSNTNERQDIHGNFADAPEDDDELTPQEARRLLRHFERLLGIRRKSIYTPKSTTFLSICKTASVLKAVI